MGPLAGLTVVEFAGIGPAPFAAMLLVNDPGSWDAVYAPLEHATWHGCTPTGGAPVGFASTW